MDKMHSLIFTVRIICFTCISFLLLSCAGPHREYRVESFQLMQTDWDRYLYENMRVSSIPYIDVDFIFNSARNTEEMVRQIEDAIESKPDVFIVHPVESPELAQVIQKAYDSGINIILVGQTAGLDCFHSIVVENSSGIGKMLANAIIDRMPEGGNVIEVLSECDDPSYHQRVESCRRILDNCDNIHIVGSFDAGGKEEAAHSGMDSLKQVLNCGKVDLVFSYAHDEVIAGVIRSEAFPDAIFIGSGAYNSNSLELVADRSLDFTIYSTLGGAKSIDIASSIVHRVPYDRYNYNISIPVSADNVHIVLDRSYRNDEYKRKMTLMDDMVGSYDAASRWKTFFILLSSILFLMSVILLLKIKKGKTFQSLLEEQNSEMDEKIKELLTQNEINEVSRIQIEKECNSLLQVLNSTRENAEPVDVLENAVFIQKFKDVVKAEIDNPDLSIDLLASKLLVSRSQLFRRVRADFGMTPNELVQSIRLQIAEAKLKSEDMTVAEVAYSTGFNSPSYFAKCFKEKYGVLPNDIRHKKEKNNTIQ